MANECELRAISMTRFSQILKESAQLSQTVERAAEMRTNQVNKKCIDSFIYVFFRLNMYIYIYLYIYIYIYIYIYMCLCVCVCVCVCVFVCVHVCVCV